jgi:hypothetical protein
MLLTEAFNISDNALCEKFGLSVTIGETSLSGLRILHSAQGCNHLETLKMSWKTNQDKSDSDRITKVRKSLLFFLSHDTNRFLKVPGGMIVQCFDSDPMALSPVETSQPQNGRKQCPFIHLDGYLGGGWSSVYTSSKSNIVVKFANAPKKDKAMLERLFTVERNVYHKLASAHLTGWVAPHFYGEYCDEWYGRQVLVFSDEGPSLDTLGMEFTMKSLGFVERCDSLASLCREFG